MAEYLRELPVEAAAHAALYLAGTPFAEADRPPAQRGRGSLWQAVKELAQASDAAMQAAYRRHGDMGAAAFDLLSAHRGTAPATLTIEDVAESFAEMAALRGIERRRSGGRRCCALCSTRDTAGGEVPHQADAGRYAHWCEAGAGGGGDRGCDERELTAVRRAVMLLGDLSEVVRLADADRLDEARMRLFHPLGFMLASPVDSVEEAMARFAEEVRAEQKGEGGASASGGRRHNEAGHPMSARAREAHVRGALTKPTYRQR